MKEGQDNGIVVSITKRLCNDLGPNQNSTETVPARYKQALPASLLPNVLKWYYSLDHAAYLRFSKNGQDQIEIALKDPPPLPSILETKSHNEYWTYRQAPSALIRPVFLREPKSDSLYDFQRDGVEWLLKNNRAILADDMGLGKTVQAIFALRRLLNKGDIKNCLIVCPKSLISNWEDELTKWAPEIGRIRVNTPAKDSARVWKYLPHSFHVTIINYEKLADVVKTNSHVLFDAVIADEAHRVRNLSSSTTKNIKKIKSNYMWILTGTPLERDKKDFVTLMSIVDPQRFSESDFTENISTLRNRASLYVLRRNKSDVLKDLPQLLEKNEKLELTILQKRAYSRITNNYKNGKGDIDGHLALITKLLSVCNFDPTTGSSSKIERSLEIIENIISNGDKVIVFSYFNKPLDIIAKNLENLKLGAKNVMITGRQNAHERKVIINKFKTDIDVNILLASARVAGEGLTLTEANNIVFLNEWWNPSSNKQAQDRVLRIGQKKPVTVFKFTCKNTIEEKVRDIIEKKKVTFDELVNWISI